ncbi:MAG: putative Ig domain-containing protein, partial [Gammaproteobacteria bacterium]
VRYTPAANLNGSNSDSFTVTVNNMNTGTSRTITFNLSITAVNDQPSITSTAPSSATEGVQYSYPVVVNDPDDAFGAGLSIALSNAPTGMTVNPSTGVITWTPGNGVASSGTVTVTVTDGGEDGAVAAVQMFSVSVTATNDPPSITSTAPTTATEDVQYSYTVGVSDIDDTNNGTDLTFSLSNQPAGMVVSTMGVITWTPLEGVLTSGMVTVQVADGGENGSLPDTENFTVTVTPVNDPPSITSADPSTTLTEGGAFSHQVTASDVDDTGGLGTDLTASLSNQPAAMAVNSTGLISWTVPRTGVFNNQYSNIVISVADGGEDGAVPDTLQFTLTVNPPDSDADGVADYADNCPSTPNGAAEDNQADNDGDTQYMANAGFPAIGDVDSSDPATGGNACDTDDDNDGMSDSFEATYSGAPCFLDPFDAADAALDCDGDGISNLDEFNASSAPDVDSVGPVVTAPADVTVNAKGYLTRVDIGVASAGDGNDGSISIIKPIVDATLSTCSELSSYPLKAKAFRPGAHVVRWTTCDKAGNLSFDAQNVWVKPIINTTAGQTVGEGQVAVMMVRLNGPAAKYPVKVDYQAVAGLADSSDHNATSGTITIGQSDIEGNTPGLVGKLNINIIDDGIVEDGGDFSIMLSNASNAVLGSVKSHRIFIAESDSPPIVNIAIAQAGNSTGNKVYADAGNAVTVTATTTDTRTSTVPVFDWSMTHNAISLTNITSTSSTSTLAIDLGTVPVGNYPVTVKVNDNGRETTAGVLLRVIATSPDVSDCNVDGTPDSNTDCDGDGVDNVTEGVTDSDADGIADYLDDNRIVDAAAIQNQSGDPVNSYLLTTDSGLGIRLGTTAQTADAIGVLVSQQNIDEHGGQAGGAGLESVDSYANLGGFYDFEITGLNEAIYTARVVIPLQSAILSGAQYRKYNGASWATFVENDLNSISSAKGELGVCPAPGSIEYTPGLTAFDFCVQLTLEDGGPNDADGLRNYVVRDPGGVALPPETVATPAAADGRLGTLHPALLLLVLPPLLLARRRARC